jgi:hypothetical protein
MKLFSEGKSPVDVVVGLHLPADRVRAIYRYREPLSSAFSKSR